MPAKEDLIQTAASLREAINLKSCSQKDLDALISNHQQLQILRKDKDEILPLIDGNGNHLSLAAPRWFCHLMGLRHLCVHIILTWRHRKSLNYVLQMRSFSKLDSPGKLDIIGGHVESHESLEESLYREMFEEMGLSKDVLGNVLKYAGAYDYEGIRPEDHFYNREWREIYYGEISTAQLEQIGFEDGEVAGMFLCPEEEIHHLLRTESVPIGSSLRESLPVLWKLRES